MSKQYHIKVTQKHIDKAIEILPTSKWRSNSCPIALAIKGKTHYKNVMVGQGTISIDFRTVDVVQEQTVVSWIYRFDKFNRDKISPTCPEPFEFDIEF